MILVRSKQYPSKQVRGTDLTCVSLFRAKSTFNSLILLVFSKFYQFQGIRFESSVLFVISSITGFLTWGNISPEKFVLMIG